ncbi:hypothetical protein FRACYDRAFT_237486 [Fragilariopsis cylindrus CCMP1102]|uniref:Uncharacterized protein n=1 Tax=Fragilariopsis cylindrus CCMP1102 TaxID=635003 RepID=A0A1E7FM94_9STRA|nr:hypothetical protein FRACYDRAFT_237486 [Fragilariopsis cylindrus CCMP1102]|eukprot:OEU19195.1 hypothetical protein FRACYDRAFT_237486 [Fragilariopsis cylindrus CCMP1102]
MRLWQASNIAPILPEWGCFCACIRRSIILSLQACVYSLTTQVNLRPIGEHQAAGLLYDYSRYHYLITNFVCLLYLKGKFMILLILKLLIKSMVLIEENDIDDEIFSLGGFAVPENVIGSPFEGIEGTVCGYCIATIGALTQLLDVILLALNFDVHTCGRGKDRANNLSLLRKTDSAGLFNRTVDNNDVTIIKIGFLIVVQTICMSRMSRMG